MMAHADTADVSASRTRPTRSTNVNGEQEESMIRYLGKGSLLLGGCPSPGMVPYL